MIEDKVSVFKQEDGSYKCCWNQFDYENLSIIQHKIEYTFDLNRVKTFIKIHFSKDFDLSDDSFRYLILTKVV